MRRSNRYVAALAVLLLAGACGTAADTPFAPEAGPRMDSNGGYAVGGNRSDTDEEETGYDTTDTSTTSAASDTTSRGGGYAVGGN